MTVNLDKLRLQDTAKIIVDACCTMEKGKIFTYKCQTRRKLYDLYLAVKVIISELRRFDATNYLLLEAKARANDAEKNFYLEISKKEDVLLPSTVDMLGALDHAKLTRENILTDLFINHKMTVDEIIAQLGDKMSEEDEAILLNLRAKEISCKKQFNAKVTDVSLENLK